jgi:hypothetical protein
MYVVSYIVLPIKQPCSFFVSNIIRFPPNAAISRELTRAIPDEAARARALTDAELLFKAYRIHRKTHPREHDDREVALDAFREELEKLHGTAVARERSANARLLLDTWEEFVGSELDT